MSKKSLKVRDDFSTVVGSLNVLFLLKMVASKTGCGLAM